MFSIDLPEADSSEKSIKLVQATHVSITHTEGKPVLVESGGGKNHEAQQHTRGRRQAVNILDTFIIVRHGLLLFFVLIVSLMLYVAVIPHLAPVYIRGWRFTMGGDSIRRLKSAHAQNDKTECHEVAWVLFDL